MRTNPQTAHDIHKKMMDYKLKAPVFPPEMVILIDTREQQSPLFGRYPKGMTVSCQTLKLGDYSLRGMEHLIALERGDESKDDVTGEVLTEEIYEREKAKNLRLGVPNAGLLGFKKDEEGEGYEAINIPGSELRQVASGVGQKLQLEDGQ